MEENVELQNPFEFEPVMLRDNTEVKLPVSVKDKPCVSVRSMCDPLLEAQGATALSSEIPFDSTLDSRQCGENSEFFEYNRLIELFRELPCDLFVTRILSDYNSCEQSLDNVRGLLFETVKSNEDFPFDLATDLKRRVFTRKGDPVSVKLANDIHALIAVIEGDEYTNIKDMISNSRRRSTVSGNAETRSQHGVTFSSTHHCTCTGDIKQLKDSIVNLQGDLLLLKQSQAVVQKLRSDEYKVVTESVASLKEEISRHISLIRDDITTLSSSITSSYKNVEYRVDDVSRDLTKVYDRLNSLEHFLDSNEIVSVTKLSAEQCPAPDKVKSHESVIEDSTIPITLLPNSSSSEECFGLDHVNWCNDTELSDMFPLGVDRATQTHENETVDQSVQCSFLTESTHKRYHAKSYRQASTNTSRKASVRRSVTFADIIDTIGTPSEPRCNGIPVRITHREDLSDYEDFTKFVAKRTKSYFVGGFSSTMTESKFISYVNKRGPKVTSVRIFKCRKNPSEIIIRLNVRNNDKSDLLQKQGFWPQGVTCKVWRTRTELSRLHSNGKVSANCDINNTYYRIPNDNWSSSNIDSRSWSDSFADYNIYMELNSDTLDTYVPDID